MAEPALLQGGDKAPRFPSCDLDVTSASRSPTFPSRTCALLSCVILTRCPGPAFPGVLQSPQLGMLHERGADPLLVPAGAAPPTAINTQQLTAEKELNSFAQRRSLIPITNTPEHLPSSSHLVPLQSPGSCCRPDDFSFMST